jgi:hypothetical protein
VVRLVVDQVKIRRQWSVGRESPTQPVIGESRMPVMSKRLMPLPFALIMFRPSISMMSTSRGRTFES